MTPRCPSQLFNKLIIFCLSGLVQGHTTKQPEWNKLTTVGMVSQIGLTEFDFTKLQGIQKIKNKIKK